MEKKQTRWISEVKEDPQTGDLLIDLPESLLNTMGWKIGDDLSWTQGTDGAWIIRKSIDIKV